MSGLRAIRQRGVSGLEITLQSAASPLADPKIASRNSRQPARAGQRYWTRQRGGRINYQRPFQDGQACESDGESAIQTSRLLHGMARSGLLQRSLGAGDGEDRWR